MPSRPLLRYDAFGTPDQVIHDIEARVPHVFPEHAAAFVVSLKKLVRQNANQFGWQYVVLSVNQGMPREELDVLLQHMPQHRGPLVIDPTLLHPQNNFYENAGDLRTDSERLAMMCEGGDDVLVTLYGTDGISHLKTVQLLQARLRMLDMTFEMLKVDLTPDPRKAAQGMQLNKDLKRLDLARKVLGEVNQVLDISIRENLDPDGNVVGSSLMELRSDLHFLMTQGYEPGMQHNLEVADYLLQNSMRQFAELSPNYVPPEPPRAQPAPAHGHDAQHNFYYDINNPRPRY